LTPLDESPSKSRRKSNSPRSANISKAAAQQSRSRSSSTAKRSGEESLWKSSPSLSTAELHPPQRGHKADLAGNEKRRKSHKGRDRSRSVHQQKDLPTIDSSHALPSALVEDEKLSLRPLVARHDDWLVEEPSETYSRATITEYKVKSILSAVVVALGEVVSVSVSALSELSATAPPLRPLHGDFSLLLFHLLQSLYI